MPLVARIVVALSIFLAVPLHAALSVSPHAPTTADAITLRVEQFCVIGSHTVTRIGTDIRVDLVNAGSCPSPPFPYAHEVSLGKLPPGRYHVLVPDFYGDQTLDFVVRDPAPAVSLRPSVILANTPGQTLWAEARQDFSLCGDISFCTANLEIGGVAVQVPNSGPALTTFTAPALTPGWKDLRVTTPGGTTVFPAALYVHEAGSAPDIYAFERVLFPVLFTADGAHGSSWISEAVIFNPTRYAIRNASEVAPGTALLEPRSRKEFAGQGYPRGKALLVPRAEAENVAFSLRVRDVSREAAGLGTNVPVVRERDMYREPGDGPLTAERYSGVLGRNGNVALLDVPRDPRYRTKVRIYAYIVENLDVYEGATVLRVFRKDGSFEQELPITLVSSCPAPECPLSAEVDVAAGSEGDRVDLFVELHPRLLGWAFASVTNNDTQQVTIVAPNGKGGRHWE